MTYYQTQSVTSENDRQLSEKYRRLTEENNSLEVRIQTLHALAPEIIQRKEEYGVLLEKFEHLANQSNSFPSKQTPGLRDVGGSGAVRNGAPGFQSSLSWDFEALALKERKSGEPGNEAEVLEKIIARFENELTTNKIELELIQKQMQGQSENEKISKKEVRRRDNTEPMQEGETVNRMSYVTTSGQDISSTSTDKIQELENLVNLLNRRIEELLEKDQEMENRVNILNKQKEELLHVNHQWDEQYRLLKDDKDRTISEMKKRTNTQLVSEAELQGQDDEVSQQRNKQVVELTQKNKALSEEVARLLEKQQKTDQLWVSAKKMITEEREARTAACQQKQLVQERYKELENQLQVEKQTQGYLKQEIERLVSGSDRSSSGSPVGNLPLPSNVTEQIEMLKQQIRVYADDFANERSDRERIQAEREVQKENLKAYENEINLLKEQVRIYQDDFDKERREKEKVQRQLRDRRQASDESSWYVVPPNDYMAMGVANPVQRRQPLYQERNYRVQANYTPREIQELAFQQQQQIRGNHGRGNHGGHAEALCHGCETDRDVIDGASPGTLKCPRCDRKFSSNERRAFDEHIDKCTT